MTERKEFTFSSFKSTSSGDFEGYASVFGNVDLQNDVVVKGAFQESLPRFIAGGFFAWQHDWDDPIGYPTTAREDSRGLFVAGKFHSTPEAQRVRTIAAERVSAGRSLGMSIGFDVPKGGAVRRQDGVRELRKIELYEASIVLMPANPEAMLTGAKAGATSSASLWADYEHSSKRLARTLERLRFQETKLRLSRQLERLSAWSADPAEQPVMRTFLHMRSHISDERRALAEHTARAVALELGLAEVPHVKFFVGVDNAGDDVLVHYSGFRLRQDVRGRCVPGVNDHIDVRMSLFGEDLVEVVAHEVRHLATARLDRSDGEDEADAFAYGQGYAARWRAYGSRNN